MSNNACNPTPSSPADFYPESECEPCNDPSTNECGCDMNDLTWDISVTECMATLDVIQGDTLYQVLSKIAAKFCDLDCADIFMPGTYLNTGFVGTEKTCAYDITGASFVDVQCWIIINGITYDCGIPLTVNDFIDTLNALNKGVWSYGSNTITVTGYYVFGLMTIDDGIFTSVCTSTGEYMTLCDYAGAVDAEFEVVLTDIATEVYDRTLADANLQTQIDALGKQVIHSDLNDETTISNSFYEALKTYSMPADTLISNGDMLIIELTSSTSDSSDNFIGKDCRLSFDGNPIGYIIGAFSGGGSYPTDIAIQRIAITRTDADKVKVESFSEFYFTSFGTTNYMQEKSANTISELSGIDFTAPINIIVQAQALATINPVINNSFIVRIQKI